VDEKGHGFEIRENERDIEAQNLPRHVTRKT
jgi:hypothetical protein